MPESQRDAPGEPGSLYDAAYYRQHCGPLPYERNPLCLGYFANIAEALIRAEGPKRVFDAGCAWGFLVEAFRDRGVEAWGVDISPYAIGQVRPDLRPFCRAASLTDPITQPVSQPLPYSKDGRYDLVTCIDVLENMSEQQAEHAIRNLCAASDAILFSSTPFDIGEPTHLNVRPIVSWLHLFSEQGFAPDVLFDASFIGPHAFLLRRRNPLPFDALMVFVEKLRVQGDLTRAQAQLAHADLQLKEVHASPGWRLIAKYRDWLSLKRDRHAGVFNVVEPVARWFLRRAVSADRVSPPSPEPASVIPAIHTHAGPVQPGPQAGAIQADVQEEVPTPSAPPVKPEAFSYKDWIIEQEPKDAELETQRALAPAFSYQPKISILVPVFRVPFEILDQMIASVVGQTYSNWELCLAHADPAATRTRQYIASLAATDPRIKVSLLDENRGISANSNVALALATGEFIGLLDHDDTLAAFALYEVVQALNQQPSLDFLYSDQDEITYPGLPAQRVRPLLKPRWSPEILLSANYLTHFNVIATKHVRAIGGWREETDGAQDWDLFARALSLGRNVHHIPRILYHWRQMGTSIAGGGLAVKPYAEEAQLRAVREHCRREGYDAEVAFDVHRRLRILWNHPPGQTISVILVSAAGGAEPVSNAQRLLAMSALPPAEIVLLLASDTVIEDPRIRSVQVAEGATLAENISRAVEHAVGELLVFVDQDVIPANADWLSELAGPLQNREIGLVGAKLLQPDTAKIYHTGLVFTDDHQVEYIFAGEAEDIDAEFGGATWYRNWSAVSGACFGIRREVWDAVGGVSGAPRYPRLDVDLCLKVRSKAGLRILCNPFARFVQTKPAALEGWLWNVGQDAADKYVQECMPDGDPYFHNKLTCRGGKVRLRSRARPYPFDAESTAGATGYTTRT